jgi:Fur family ferric uptake transcriptional regulator
MRGGFLPSNQKFRMTHQRKMILEEVRSTCTHPTADEVYEIVRRRIPRISMGTVYRNLDVLAKNGLIQKIDPGQGHPQMRFDAKTEDHYHITCMGCGSIEDVPMNSPDDSLDGLTKKLLKATEYRVAGHSLDFYGLCPLCAKEGESSFGEKMKELE